MTLRAWGRLRGTDVQTLEEPERGGVDTEGRGLRPKLNLGAGPREAGGVLPVISGASAQPQVLLKGL